VGSDAVLEVDLFSAARTGCDRLGDGIATGSCQPIHSVRTVLMHDRMSRTGDRACSEIIAPGRSSSNQASHQVGSRSTLGKSQRWCSLRALSFLLPAVRNLTHLDQPVINHRSTETGASGFQTGELFATLGTMGLPAPAGSRSTWGPATAAGPPLRYQEGDNRYSYGLSWDSAAVYIGQDGSNRPSVGTGRFDIVVRCADDPYVVAARATALSMDFGGFHRFSFWFSHSFEVLLRPSLLMYATSWAQRL
jgi:hypothetical protein